MIEMCAKYKIRDSVDLYLIEDKLIKVYFINTRKVKKYEVSKEMILLLETINGEYTVEEIYNIMGKKIGSFSMDDLVSVLENLYEAKIISRVNQNHLLEDRDVERYNRQLNYFSEFLDGEAEAEEAQIKLKESCIAIFGCGAVGGNIAIELAMAGVEKFILVDDDIVQASDTARHIYYNESNVGKKKVNALKNNLLDINSRCTVEAIDMVVQPQTDIERIIDKSTFVINTADEPYIGYTAAKISRVCVKKNISHYIAGGFDAHLASTGELIIPYVTPCVECYATYFKEALKGWKPKPHPVGERYTEIGGLPSMTLFSTSFAAIEIIKYICGLINVADEYKTRGEFLVESMDITYIFPKKNPDCEVCGKHHE